MKLGSFLLNEQPILINKGKRCCEITVQNKGERAIQVGSHFHFFETNRALSFDREKAFGMHLDIPSGTAVRFPPGKTLTVGLTEYGGRQIMIGFNGLTNGSLNDKQVMEEALDKARKLGFLREEQE